MNIRRLDLNLLRILNVLLEERSATRASLRLGLTQSAVSASLGRLRDAFDDPLFMRTQRGLVPTPRALNLAEPVRRLLAGAEALLQPNPFSPASISTQVSVAATDYGQAVVLIPCLAAMLRAAPDLRIAIQPLDYNRLATLLEIGELDLAVLSESRVSPSLQSTRIFNDRYVLAGRRGHPHLGDSTITLDAFCKLDHAVVSPSGGSLRGPIDAVLGRHGLARNVVACVPGFLPLLSLLQHTDLVAAVPARLGQQLSKLTVLPLPVEVPGFNMVVAWHARTEHSPTHEWVRGHLAEASRRHAGSRSC